MTIEFTLLCPGKSCRKCIRMQSLLEELVRNHYPDAKVIHVNNPDQMFSFHTWLLPSLYVNEKPVARGYVPDKMTVLRKIHRILQEDQPLE